MKKALLASAALGTVFIGGSTLGADFGVRAPSLSPAFTWTGCYIGAHAGATMIHVDGPHLSIPKAWSEGRDPQLERAIAYIQRYRASGALIVLDVDRLKPINDAFGHAAGDQVLKAIVDVLTRQVRASDVVGRLGGDEFGLLLWNLSETDARAKAAMLEADIDRLAFAFDGKNVTAGASAGVAILGPHSNAARALEEADSVMYVRKAQRRHEPKSAAD